MSVKVRYTVTFDLLHDVREDQAMFVDKTALLAALEDGLDESIQEYDTSELNMQLTGREIIPGDRFVVEKIGTADYGVRDSQEGNIIIKLGPEGFKAVRMARALNEAMKTP